MSTWFCPKEARWMMKFLPTYATFNRAKRVVYKGKRVGAMKAFLGGVINEFAEKFPYRHPDTPLSQIPVNLHDDRCMQEEWEELHDKFRHRFNYLKTRYANELEAGVVWESEGEVDIVGSDEWDSENENEETMDESTEEAGSKSEEEYESEEAENMSVISVGGLSNFNGCKEPADNTVTMPAAAAKAGSESIVTGTNQESCVDPAEDYVASPNWLRADIAVASKLREEFAIRWNLALDELRDRTSESWTGCTSRELKFRRSNVLENLCQVLDIVAWGTGTEFFATGVAASPDSAQGSRQFAMRYLGPALCTGPECPGPAIYGDLDRENHPLMPKELLATTEQKRVYIFDYQRHKLSWQGGGMEVPYDRIKADAEQGRYHIMKADNVPPDIMFVENPFTIPAEHVDPWFEYLTWCDTAQVPEDWQFQFARPDPDGAKVDGYQTVRSPGVRMEYGPEAHSYALFVQGMETTNPEPREDGLPLYYADNVVFHSVSSSQRAFWQGNLPRNGGYMGLLDALQRNDNARPFQAPVEFWNIIVESMPHLKPEPPTPDAGIRQLRTKKGRVPSAFFNYAHPLYAQSCLHHALNWCSANVKWPVNLLGHLELNTRHVTDDPVGLKAHYASIVDRVEIQFTDNDRHQIQHTIQLLTDALNASTDQLTQSLTERQLLDPCGQALKASARAHENYPQDLDSFEWFKSDGSRCVVVTTPEGTTRHPIVSAKAGATEFESHKGKQKEPRGTAQGTSLKHARSSRPSPELRGKQARRAVSNSQSVNEDVKPPDSALAGLSIAGPSARTWSKSQGTQRGRGKSGRMKMDVVINLSGTASQSDLPSMDDSALTELTMLSEHRLPTPPAAGPQSSASTLDNQSHNGTSDIQPASDPEPSMHVTPTVDACAESASTQPEIWTDPNLAPTRDDWRANLRELLDCATNSFLTQGAELEATRALSNEIPRFLNSCIQTLAWSTGDYIEAKALWFNHDDPSTVRAYSTLSTTADALNIPSEVQDEMGYFADRVFA
ncbi:hypothetical protein V565_220460, partial [Rhizoctonia solani 123E]